MITFTDSNRNASILYVNQTDGETEFQTKSIRKWAEYIQDCFDLNSAQDDVEPHCACDDSCQHYEQRIFDIENNWENIVRNHNKAHEFFKIIERG
jgi:hypothetical protein